MRSRSQNPASEEPNWKPEEIRTAFLFWLFWSAYVFLSAILIAALLTNWPDFLHTQSYYFR